MVHHALHAGIRAYTGTHSHSHPRTPAHARAYEIARVPGHANAAARPHVHLHWRLAHARMQLPLQRGANLDTRMSEGASTRARSRPCDGTPGHVFARACVPAHPIVLWYAR